MYQLMSVKIVERFTWRAKLASRSWKLDKPQRPPEPLFRSKNTARHKISAVSKILGN
jgi:hypothetical protein